MKRLLKMLLSFAMYFERKYCPNTAKHKSTGKKKNFNTKK